jgi:hypothetical protein
MRDLGSLFAERFKRRLVVGCLSTVIGGVVGCCCLILLPTVFLPFLDTVAAGGNENTTMLVLLGIGLLALFFLFAVPVIVALVLIQRRARALDAVFTPLGLTGRSYMLYGRHYQGQFAGREVDIYIYRGPTVEVRLRATPQTRVQVMAKGSLPASVAGAFNKQPLALNDPALEAFAIYPVDEPWTCALLAEPPASQALQTLMTVGASWAIFRTVELQPGEVLLHLNRSRQSFFSSIDLSNVRTWLESLQTLAQTAESLPAPQVTAPPTGVTRQGREQLNKFLLYTVLFIVFVMPVGFIAIGALAALIVSLK